MSDDGFCYRNSTVYETDSVYRNSLTPSFQFKPRSGLAKVLYEKQQTDEYLSHLDKKQWYYCRIEKLPPELSSKFIQLEPDEDTLKFLQQSEEKSDWIPTQIWHSIARLFLGLFMTQTSINGWLQRGSMFVLSHPQFRKLLRVDSNWQQDSLLDLGAGDGEVTAHLTPAFRNVYVTEMSTTMRQVLQKKGYKLLEVDNWHLERKFDVISCLNLIDRCDRPYEILEQIRESLKPNGLLLLAVVLPFSPYVESGSPDRKPKEVLPIKGFTFVEQVKSVIDDVLIPMGFEVVSWTRVPYLCEGDLQQSYYWLDDAVFVVKVGDRS